MPAVGDKRDRPEGEAADDFQDHHRAAERDHRPGLAFAAAMFLPEKNMVVKRGARTGRAHVGLI
jgi:hypothetical protein